MTIRWLSWSYHEVICAAAGCLLTLLPAQIADAFSETGGALSVGFGEPDRLVAYRLSGQIAWFQRDLHNKQLLGYWELSDSYLRVRSSRQDQPKALNVFALSPVFYFKTEKLLFMQPYIAIGIGPAILSHTCLGRRDLGGHFAFQDRVGFGFTFGRKEQFRLEYDYIHYSNAKLYQSNQGIDIKQVISLGYDF